MKDQNHKNLDTLAKRVIEQSVLEKPSKNFTMQVMSRISEIKTSNVTAYKPLISRKGWGVILFGFVVLVIALLFSENDPSPGWFNSTTTGIKSNLNNLQLVLLHKWSAINITKSFSYAFILLCVMICVHIPILKHHFNSKYKL